MPVAPLPTSKRAFSLVELSIVLVILGLLVGGILAGKSLIHAAELRSGPRDFQKYATATYAFRDKYFGRPGDISTASSFWGAADGDDGTDATGANCTFVVSTTTATCNGNDDGTYTTLELFRAWQQLANAGLIEGQYTGTQDLVTGFGPTYYTSGLNIPSSRLKNAAFTFVLHGGPPGVKFGPPGTSGNNYFGAMTLGLIRPLSASGGTGPTGIPFYGALSHEDAWNIDTKMDDGVASTGKVRADFIKATGAAITITDMGCQTYDLTNSTNYCALGFLLQ